MVECQLPKLDVAGSTPVSRSKNQQPTSITQSVKGGNAMKASWTLAVLCLSAPGAAATPEKALAVLENRCLQCHNDKVAMAGLKLLSRDQLLKGGSRGPAITPGKSADSLLIKALTHENKLAMPPGAKLPDAEVAVLREWIDGGAEWPYSAQIGRKPATDWWAFHKPVRPPVPNTGAKNPIDAFVVEKLRKAGLEPSATAGKLSLLRRATYDLHGLPPTENQIESFLNDARPYSWERLIDTLLDSPRYGEKWGRHWLDLVRYGDTSGFEQDPYALEAFRYRDYVIKAFNDDKPYDRFTKEQIAGDELWPDDADSRIGTGYYRVGPNRDMLFKVEDLNVIEKLTDYVDTTSTVFLGLTTGCARCHDHKFDPIPQRDYYRMQAIFAPVVNDRIFLEYNAGRNYDLNWNGREFRLRQLAVQIDAIFKPYRERITKEKTAKLSADAQQALRLKPEERTTDQQLLALSSEPKTKASDDQVRAALSQTDSEVLHSLEKRLVAMFAGYAPPPMAPGVIDVGREAPRTYIAHRGNWQNPGDEVGPGFPTALGGGDVAEPPRDAKSSFRRKAFAEWLASAENPMFARVMVNRIWMYHFGNPLLGTPSDFGVRAGRPSHPELLDWLSTEFAERKWSIKSMHRLIMTSEAYRRSANASAKAHADDPQNLLLSHMNRRRLLSEEIRDAVLQVSGTLNLKMGGVPVVVPLEAEELYGIIGNPTNSWSVTPDKEEHTRRSVYLLTRRTFKQPMMEAFDSPDGVASCSRRNESTTAPQSLAMLNSRFMLEQSRLMASKTQSVEEAWKRVLGRAPSDSERKAAEAFLAKQTVLSGSKEAAMAELARSLINLNEFLYVD